MLEASPNHEVEPLRHGGPDRKTGGFVRDAKLDPGAVLGLREREAALLLDQPRLRDPPDLLRAAPSIQTQRALQRHRERDHLDAVAGSEPARLRADRLPFTDALQDLCDVVVIGKEVEDPLGRRLDGDLGGELKPGHATSKILAWSGGVPGRWRSKTRSAAHPRSPATSCAIATGRRCMTSRSGSCGARATR